MELNPTFLPFRALSTASTPDDEGIDYANHAAADMGIFEVPFKCEVVRAYAVITEDLAGTNVAGQVKFDRRFTAGSDTGRADGDVATLNFGVTGVSAEGDVAYDNAGMGVSLEPGMQVVVQCVSAPSGTGETGHIWPMLLVRPLPETAANMSALQETS